MRIPLSLASTAALALALAACGQGADSSTSTPAAIAADVDDKSLEEQVMAALEDAPRHGLTKDLFLKDGLPSGGERRDALIRIARDYASALADGKVDPAKLREVYTVPRPKADLSAGLSQALAENKFREWANSLAPQTQEYRALSEAFVQLVQRSPGLPDPEIPAGDTINPGDSDPRVRAIAANLRAQGYLAEAGQRQAGEDAEDARPAPSGNRYAPALVEAVKRWQADSGLKVDGIIGGKTIEALNSSPRDRARTLAVAMERLRWLDRNPPATRIDVNTAATILHYFRDGQLRDQRRVVAGEPDWETPQLGSPIYALVANPNWVVPESIVEDEISKKSGAWLRQNNFVRKDGRWVQQPGPESALGLVKFAMRNDESIYLHDTPAKALFAEEERHKSHGCVRVQNAVQFANMIAQDNGILNQFNQAMAKDDETEIALQNEIPVRLMYHTAYLDADGRVKFAQDVYGWDNDVATALGYETRQRAEFEHRPSDVGP